MGYRWKSFLLFLLFSVAGVFCGSYIISCSSDELGETAKTLNRGLTGEPETLNPHNFSTNQARSVLRDIGEGLLTYSPDGQLAGGVAESWTVSSDGLTYSFILRENAKWSNGSPITADDFVRSFRNLADPLSAARHATSIEKLQFGPEIIRGEADREKLGVTAMSMSQLELRLHSRAPYFIQLLTHPSLFPVPAQIDSYSNRDSSGLISNGPYSLDSWVIGSEIRLEKNENYWNSDEVDFDSVVYHIVRESAEVNRFRAGEIDITENVPSGEFEKIKEDFPNQLKVSPYLGVYYYGFNLKQSKFAGDLKLRRALSLAIDREVLVEKVTRRGEQAAYGWVPPGISFYTSQVVDELMLEKTKREKLARQLYEESGYGPDRPLIFELRYNDSDVQQRIALAMQGMWKDVLGARANLKSEEFKVFLSNIQMEDVTETFRLSWTGDYNDAHSFLYIFESGDPSNVTGYSNKKFDEIMVAAGAETDLNKRRLLLQTAEQIVLTDHAVIPLYFYVSKHLVSNRVVGWSANVLDIHPSQYLSPASK